MIPHKKPTSTSPFSWIRNVLPGAGLCLLAAAAFLAPVKSADAQSYTIAPIWSAGIGTANLVNDGNNRSVAYNAVSNQVYVAGRTTSTLAISVFDGTSGNVIATDFPHITITPYNIGVADDGVIYGVPLANGVSAANLNIYAFTNWNSLQRQCYQQVSGDAASTAPITGQRVGDSFAIYGGGVNTLILLPVNTGTSTHATNLFLLFSTTDGQTFKPTLLTVTGIPTPLPADGGPEHGVAFLNSTNFIFRPGQGSSTYSVAFPANFASLGNSVTATTIATNTTLPSGTGSDVYQFSYSPAGHLLADYGQLLNGAGSTALAVYDISGFPNVSALGSTTTTHANANGNYTGGVALGGAGKTNAVYALDSNNGLYAFSLTFVPAAVAPVINTAPTGGSFYTNLGSYTFSVSAAGTVPLTYEWQFNTTSNLSTANTFLVTSNSSYTISNLTVSASGWYDVIVTNVAGSATSAPVQLTITTPLASAYVTNIWSLKADNSQPYLDTSYNTRGLAYDPLSQSVLVAEHSAAQIYALNITNGGFKFLITTPETGLPEGSIFPLGQVGVADDGAVYCCNVSSYNPNSDTAVPGQTDFSITRFDSVVNATNVDGSPNPTNTFEAAFTGDPGAFQPQNPGASSGDRWGDSMAVRGGGTNTEIICGTYETIGANQYGTGPGTNVAIFTTLDGTNFTATTIAVTNAPDGFSYLGVAWGSSNTFWTKSPGYDLRQVEYNLTTGIGWVIQDFSTTAGQGSLSSVCGIALDVTNNILAGVNTSDNPNDLELFQIPSLGQPPESYYQAFFPSYNPNINGNAATTIKYPYIFSLDANNGIIALTYTIPLLPFEVLTTTVGKTEVLTLQSVSGHSYQLQSATALVGSNVWTNVGSAVTAASSGTLSFTNNITAASTMFYRVVGQ